MARSTAAVILGAALVACKPSGGSTSNGTASVTGSGGSGAGSSSGGAGGASAAYDGYGSITAFSYHYTSPSDTIVAGAGASFSKPVGTSCVQDKVSSCEIYDCPTGGMASPQVSAGVVKVQGGSEDITLTPGANGMYMPLGVGTDLFTGGEAMTFDVAGSSEVPPHAGALTAPSEAVVSSPVFEGLVIDRTVDLKFIWSGANQPDEEVVFIASTTELSNNQPVRTVVIQCFYAGVDGQGTVPAAALGHLLVTGATVQGAALARASTEVDVPAGKWRTTFLLQATARTPSGAGATGAATVL